MPPRKTSKRGKRIGEFTTQNSKLTAIPPGIYTCEISAGPYKGCKFISRVDLDRNLKTEAIQVQTSQPAPATHTIGALDTPQSTALTTAVLHARRHDAAAALRRAAMNHATAVRNLESTDIRDYTALSHATDRLSSAQYDLIEARHRVLNANRTND